MAPGNMKSDFIGLQRIKIEGKTSLNRKGVSKNGDNFEGEFQKINMNDTDSSTTTTHNGVSNVCTIPSPVQKLPRQTDHCKTDFLASGDHVSLPDRLKVKSDHQVPHLKSLSMLHLDFIEQQQKQLQSQEKEIQKLRSENDTLKCRLERMKRRTVLAGKGDQPNIPTNHIVTNQRKDTFFKRKRPTVFDLPQATRKQLAASGQQQPEQHESEESVPSPTSKSSPTKGTCSKRVQHSRWVKKDLPNRSSQRGSKSKGAKETHIDDGEERVPTVSGEETIDEASYERTPILYPCLSDLRVDLHDPDLPDDDGVQAVLSNVELMVPSWRQRTVSASSVENTGEELTDEAFDKRHSKLEVDERKRKRWDFQRIRELREHERLERNLRRKELGVWEETLFTFCPDSADAHKLQVEDTVPVVAFGALVPPSEKEDFDVPWFDAQTRESADTRREKRSRACKK